MISKINILIRIINFLPLIVLANYISESIFVEFAIVLIFVCLTRLFPLPFGFINILLWIACAVIAFFYTQIWFFLFYVFAFAVMILNFIFNVNKK